jgi:hypothetical protein
VLLLLFIFDSWTLRKRNSNCSERGIIVLDRNSFPNCPVIYYMRDCLDKLIISNYLSILLYSHTRLLWSWNPTSPTHTATWHTACKLCATGRITTLVWRNSWRSLGSSSRGTVCLLSTLITLCFTLCRTSTEKPSLRAMPTSALRRLGSSYINEFSLVLVKVFYCPGHGVI